MRSFKEIAERIIDFIFHKVYDELETVRIQVLEDVKVLTESIYQRDTQLNCRLDGHSQMMRQIQVEIEELMNGECPWKESCKERQIKGE